MSDPFMALLLTAPFMRAIAQSADRGRPAPRLPCRKALRDVFVEAGVQMPDPTPADDG